MDISADLGVSLDELSVEINEDDNLKPLAAVGDYGDIADINVLDIIHCQNTDIYDSLEMAASTDLGVSLDELTVEITEDDNLKQKATTDDSKFSFDIMKFGNTVNTDEHDTSEQVSTDLKTWSTDEMMIDTKPINIADNTDSSPASKIVNINTSAQYDSDSEFEVPDKPLAPPGNTSMDQSATKIMTVIKPMNIADTTDSSPAMKTSDVNTSAKDDSDSEFEVPERPSVSLGNTIIAQSDDVHAELTVNQEPVGMQCADSQRDMNINFISQNSGLLPHESLLSHSEISADPAVLLQSSQALQMPTAYCSLLSSQNNNLKFSEANKESFLNSQLEGDLRKTSQDVLQKSDSVLNNQFFMQPQVSDVTKPHMMIPVNSRTEDLKNNEEEYSRPCIVTTADDWENIQTIEPGFLQSGDRLSGPEPIIESKPLASFSDSWTYFKTEDFTSVRDKIKVQVERHGLSALRHMLFGPPKLHRDLLPQRELIFCVAATPFDNSCEAHNRILQTIYRCLTGSRFDCQRFGNHWEEIGFQGTDPATDLRGTGMLSLLHLLYFLQSPSTKDLARDVYKLSLHPTQNFPFCIMSINLSRISLQVLREDVFNKECNRSKDVISTVNNIHAALFLQLYLAWKKGKTIMDSGFVIQEIETYIRKHSKDIFKELKTYVLAKKQPGQSRKDSDAEPIFLNVCKENKS